MTLNEITERKAAIAKEVEERGAELPIDQLEALKAEAEQLNAEERALNEAAEKREALLKSVIAGAGELIEQPKKEEKKHMELDIKSPEYRSQWLEAMKSYIKEGEQRSVNAAAIPGAIPQETLDKIVENVKQYAPLLDKISLFRVNGAFSLPVEGTTNEAALHTENGAISGSADTISQILLNGYEISKLVRISRKALAMSANSFEDFIVKKLSEYIGRRVQYYLIKGTGSNEPQGLDYARTWTDTSTAVQFAGATPTAAELAEMVSLLPGAYAINANWVMNHKTFWNKVQAIRDDSKYPIVKDDAGKPRVLGFEVLLDDQVDDGDFFFGDLSQVYGNLSESINVIKSEHSGLPYNAVDYLGECVFDSKIAVPAAIVKGAASL